MLKQEISRERLENANSRPIGWQCIDEDAFLALNDGDICNFNYYNSSRRQIFLNLTKQLDGKMKELCASFIAFFAIVDTMGDQKGDGKALRRLQLFVSLPIIKEYVDIINSDEILEKTTEVQHAAGTAAIQRLLLKATVVG